MPIVVGAARGFEDSRAIPALALPVVAAYLGVAWVAGEQVAALLTARGGRDWEGWQLLWAAAGFCSAGRAAQLADHWPQHRERLLFACLRSDLGGPRWPQFRAAALAPWPAFSARPCASALVAPE